MTASERARRTTQADAVCVRAYEAAGGGDAGTALVAVGGYGRGELAPHSDLDVVLVHDDDVDVAELAATIWYPLWDSGTKLDHSVRSFTEMLAAAGEDFRVAAGLLDVRHVAGDPNLTLRLRTTLLAAWRREARVRLPEIREAAAARHRLVGELAHLSVPDLKEAEGGLRDATLLRALVATWLVDVPHTELESSRQTLLDVRDHLHEITGRGQDRIAPEHWAELAVRLGLGDDLAAQRHVRELGRRLTHLSRLTWRRAEAALVPPSRRGPRMEPLAQDVALASGEVVLFKNADLSDPSLLLRAAAAAAERRAVLAPATVARLMRAGAPLPTPWPSEARDCLVRLLASGRGLLGVWETLDETGALAAILPEWERIRLLPHASEIHRFTVDRHVVETCIEAGALIRQVSRPDVLMLSALLHDIGKGGTIEHSAAGEPIARAVAERVGLTPDAVDLVAQLVRWHLLLAQTATTRDPEDPATVETITARLPDAEAIALLTALTEADAKATSAKAWSSWRAGLITDLARRSQLALGQTDVAIPTASEEPEGVAPVVVEEIPLPRKLKKDSAAITVDPLPDGARITAIAHDRVGLLADLAAVLAAQRLPVRAARVWGRTRGKDQFGISVWDVAAVGLDAAVLRTRFEAIAAGRLPVRDRLARLVRSELAPSVAVRPDASEQATVLEVRATDGRGVVFQVCTALADLDIEVRSAHVDTLGPQAVDVFYLREAGAGALSETRAASAAHAVRGALTRPA